MSTEEETQVEEQSVASTVTKVDDSHGRSSPLRELAAEWRTEKYIAKVQKETIKSEVLCKIKETTELIKSFNSCNEKQNNSKGTVVEIFDWESLYDISSGIIDNYTSNVDSILNELDQLYRKQGVWQEAAFIMDSHRGAAAISKAEEWMTLKEDHLKHKSSELEKFAKDIGTTLERLSSDK
ncbi:Gmc2p NDAI_0J02770 [Naumovozyma dairenensis CBS 421]|uniref:Grand meiotic recombination cluster protein 2 n=1 Tax=Naumovozyma dairenensis (strain ATCC 10597 / BCRC 20456 / CBS 421 / NBRC 0211 / NRRL Y-12639) TaxID=1071378 RepID=G0WH91_NAUDC|nr:hypothetical protein NDAI_0J02770 [Naumovozyma dairenensis CBS 421]CCD27169.1 hypothetical protein NDAI_0J02770 [Naumovozyma dairenensis CBS 421]